MATPVTILCGELGAGKTTLLSHLLAATDDDLAVVVNDVGAVNVDADLVEARTDLATGEEVLALENGCICCSLGGELSRSVVRLHQRREFDHLVIEASGVGEPEPIARQFVRGPAAGPYDLANVVTVVDGRRFVDRFATAGDDTPDLASDAFAVAEPARQGPDDDGTKPLADLVLEQIEFCDLLVLNKGDLLTADERAHALAILETLQPRAEVVTTEFGALDPAALVATDRFELEAATEAAGWKQLLGDDGDSHDHAGHTHDDHPQHVHDEQDGHTGHDESSHDHSDHDHSHDQDAVGHAHDDDHSGHSHDHSAHSHDHRHPPEAYGIVVETYQTHRPLHPERFAALLAELPTELVRAKGLCFVAGRERQAITMSYAASRTTLEVTGRWIASLGEARQEQYRTEDTTWDDEWGDRETNLALIGRNLDLEGLIDRLDACRMTDDELAGDPHALDNPAPTSEGQVVTIASDGPSVADPQ